MEFQSAAIKNRIAAASSKMAAGTSRRSLLVCGLTGSGCAGVLGTGSVTASLGFSGADTEGAADFSSDCFVCSIFGGSFFVSIDLSSLAIYLTPVRDFTFRHPSLFPVGVWPSSNSVMPVDIGDLLLLARPATAIPQT